MNLTKLFEAQKEMENYKQITFEQAMKEITNDNLDNLYFKTPNGIDCVRKWRIDVENLKNEKWYLKEIIR